MQITVSSHYTWPDYITIRIYEDEIMTHCNHEGHYPDTFTVDDGLPSERNIRAEVCDKCDAWSYDGEEWF